MKKYKFNKMIPIIERELTGLKLGKVYTITGKTKNKEIPKIVRKLEKDKASRFLICSDAFSYGANLQFAEYVINFDLPWNPAIVEQRIRRVYRQGQKKHVTVMNLVTTGTVEDRILEVLGTKRELFAKFLGTGKIKRSKVGIKSLLKILKG